jgi:GTP-binding protein LepA
MREAKIWVLLVLILVHYVTFVVPLKAILPFTGARLALGALKPPSPSVGLRTLKPRPWIMAKAGDSDPDWQYDPSLIRNFCIIAHIDHGKSTLADRLLEYTNTVQKRDMQEQLLDSLDIERERGITVKLQAARMKYRADDGKVYVLNLIDTPGHVDFGYEVSRSLAACEGALLVVDAAQGVEAQTVANLYMALDNNLEIIPIINKIDLPAADPQKVKEEIESTTGLDCASAIYCSAKTGMGVKDILEGIVRYLPPPSTTITNTRTTTTTSPVTVPATLPVPLASLPLQALIFDSYYDAYRGVVVFFRIIAGRLSKGDKVHFKASGRQYDVQELGVMRPVQTPVDVLQAGEVGYLNAAIRELDHARVGDTITLSSCHSEVRMLAGYAPPKAMVFCGLYPSDSDDYEQLRDAIGKLKLNDAALTFAPETSSAMGFGFRCGFLGLLHLDIVRERLEREFGVDLVVTAPSVVYKTRSGVLRASRGEIQEKDIVETLVDAANKLPDPTTFDEILEPYVQVDIIAPTEYTGALMELGQSRRGIFKELKYLSTTRSTIIYELPLAEVITDFFDQLKSRTKGYGSMSYTEIGYRADKLVKLGIRINGDDAPPLATIVHKDRAHSIGKVICEKLKDLIPQQQFRVPIQACIGAKPVASSSISALSKDVLAKCYGGDISRKKKLLKKQAKGKKRMKALGKVNVPQEAFMAVLMVNNDSK